MSLEALWDDKLAEIEARWRRVKEQLPVGCTLIVVTKNQPSRLMPFLVEMGMSDFGENYIQEMVDKQGLLDSLGLLGKCRFHLIGPLQSNKFKKLRYPVSIHTLTSKEHAHQLESKRVPIDQLMVQVNVSNDPLKAGIAVESLELFLKECPLKVTGLMTILQQDLSDELIFEHYQRLRALAVNRPVPLKTSMGMSGDFVLAVKAGADYVRVGTAILGERPTRQASGA